MGTVRSVRTHQFKEQLSRLPPEIQRIAREKYQLFLSDPFHPSFHRHIIEKTHHYEHPLWEFRITSIYRAVCFIDGNTYVWVFIGHHKDFDRLYG